MIMEWVYTSTERDREGWRNLKELAVFEATTGPWDRASRSLASSNYNQHLLLSHLHI